MVSISIKEKRKSAKYHLEALKHPEKGREYIAVCRSRSQVRATNLQWPEFFEGAHDDEVRASESVLAITRCGGGNRRHCAQLSLLKFTQLEQQPLNFISCWRHSVKMKGDDFKKWVSSHLKYCKHSVERQQLQNTFPTYFSASSVTVIFMASDTVILILLLAREFWLNPFVPSRTQNLKWCHCLRYHKTMQYSTHKDPEKMAQILHEYNTFQSARILRNLLHRRALRRWIKYLGLNLKTFEMPSILARTFSKHQIQKWRPMQKDAKSWRKRVMSVGPAQGAS